MTSFQPGSSALRFKGNGRFKLAVCLGCGALLAAAALQTRRLLGAGLDPTAHAYPAIVWTLYGYFLLHVALALLMGLYVPARFFAGHLAPGCDIDLRNTALFWYFTVLQGMLAMATIHLFPLAG